MPTYDYQCGACQHEWEEFQSMSAKPIRKCPSCGKLKAKRIIGPGAGFIFKGSGFYLTDYRSDSYKAGAEADKKSHEAPAKSGTESASTSAKSSESGTTKSESTSTGGSGKSSGGTKKKGGK